MKIFNKLVIFLMLSFSCLAQYGTVVIPSDGPKYDQHAVLAYTSGNSTYYCMARSVQSPTNVSFSTISNASVAVIAATAHGFHADTSPLVTFKGATGNWLSLNSTFVATVVDANTLSIPLNTSSFGSLTGVVVMTTTAPRPSQSVWTIMKVTNNGSSQFQSKLWAQGGQNACTSRASLSYQ